MKQPYSKMLQDNLVSIHYFTDDRQTPVDIESADFEFETLRTSYCIRDVPDAASFVSVRCKGEANFKSTIVSDVRSSSRTLPLDTSPLSWRKAGDNYHQAYLADRLEVVLQTGRTVYRLCFDRSDATDLSAYLLDENFAPVAQAHSRLKGPSPSTALVLPGREADAKYISFAVTRLSGVPVSFSCENGGPLAVWSEGPASSSAIFELSARSARPLSFQLADEQAWTASVAVTLPTYAVFPERERSCGRGGAGEAAGAPEVTEVAGRAVSFRCDDIDKYDVETDPISEFQVYFIF